MEIKKSNETINRSYVGESPTDVVENIQYNILDENGNVIGNATIWNGSASVNFSLSGFNSVSEGETKLSEIFASLGKDSSVTE